MSIGKNIRNRREEFGLDQSELAERVGVSQTMISHIEKDRKNPSIGLLADIAKVLNCTMDELVHETKTA